MSGEHSEPASAAEPAAAADERVAKAFAFVVRSAGKRPQTEAELTEKLAGRGYDEGVVAAALARARAAGVVDDAAFARAWVEDRGLARGFAAARLRQELARRRIPDHLIEDALALLGDRDELEAATEIARRRARRLPAGLSSEAAARRLYGQLRRCGYADGLAQRVALEVSGADEAAAQS